MLAQVAALAKSSKCKSIGIVLPEGDDKDVVQFVTQVSVVHSLDYITRVCLYIVSPGRGCLRVGKTFARCP